MSDKAKKYFVNTNDGEFCPPKHLTHIRQTKTDQFGYKPLRTLPRSCITDDRLEAFPDIAVG